MESVRLSIHLAGVLVALSIAVMRAACSLCDGLEEGLGDERLDVAGQEACEESGALRLEDVVDGRRVRAGAATGRSGTVVGLGERRSGARVDEVDGVRLLGDDAARYLLGQLRGHGRGRPR